MISCKSHQHSIEKVLSAILSSKNLLHLRSSAAYLILITSLVAADGLASALLGYLMMSILLNFYIMSTKHVFIRIQFLHYLKYIFGKDLFKQLASASTVNTLEG